MGHCWMDYMNGILDEIDFIGVQCHMHPFINGTRVAQGPRFQD